MEQADDEPLRRYLDAHPELLEPVAIELGEVERRLLTVELPRVVSGRVESEHVRRACGSREELLRFLERVAPSLRDGEPLRRIDWLRLSLAVQVAFGSTVEPATPWRVTWGASLETLGVVRQLQEKLEQPAGQPSDRGGAGGDHGDWGRKRKPELVS